MTLLNANPDTRYIRQVMLAEVGIGGQESLAMADITIVGLGGLGSTTAQFLAAAGIGTLHVIDPDTVELGNIHRQPLYHTRDCGRPKAMVVAQRLRAINPDITVHAHTAVFDDSTAAKLTGPGAIIIDGCDTFEARYAINRFCIATCRIMITAALRRYESVSGVFAPRHTDTNPDSLACYACAYPSRITASAQNDCNELGILGPIAGLASCQQALSTLKRILVIGDPMEARLVFTNWLTNNSYTIRVAKRRDCPVCS